jgi:dethiobiotin synthase
MLHGAKPVRFWKPIQTGTVVGDDTQTVKALLSELPGDTFWEPVYRFPEPLSPHMAAKKWGRTVEMDRLVDSYQDQRKPNDFVVIEGAGGVLIPLNEKHLQIHFLQNLALPLIIVSEDRVGAINQTLLTLNAARSAHVPILGVILTRARRTLGNAEAISLFGNVEVLAELDPSEDARSIIAQVGGCNRLRELFSLSQMPQ